VILPVIADVSANTKPSAALSLWMEIRQWLNQLNHTEIEQNTLNQKRILSVHLLLRASIVCWKHIGMQDRAEPHSSCPCTMKVAALPNGID